MAEEDKKTDNNTKTVNKQSKGPSQDEKTMGILAWILFFIPLLTDQKDSKYVKSHVNQSLNLVIFAFVANTVATVLSAILIGLLLFPIIFITVLAFWIMGIISAVNGEAKKLPLLSSIELIK